jgi:HlyD family secretion protein
MSSWIRTLILPAAALGMMLFAVYHLLTAQEHHPELSPPTIPAQTLSLKRISGTGIVEPQTENVSVGTAQTGLVLEVFYGVDRVGQRVKQGEPLFRVDDRAWQAQVEVRRANLTAAQAALTKLEQQPRPEDLPPLEARAKAAAARMAEIQDRLQRAEKMPAQAISREEVTQRRYSYEAAKYEWEQADKELARLKAGAWAADLAVAQAEVAVARANLAQVETEMERCLVRAPLEGEILQVNVRAGEFVSGASDKTLLVLGDLQKRHIRVEIDEEDIPRFQSAFPAVAITRGDAAKQCKLQFVRVEPYVVPKKMLSGMGSERVDTRVLQVIYELASPGDDLYVGQQLDVYINLDAPSLAQEH